MSESELAGTINGTVMALRLLVHQLEITTGFDRAAYAKLLTEALDDAKRGAAPSEQLRYDFLLLENLTRLIRTDPPQGPGRGWVPKVIEGGLSGPESP